MSYFITLERKESKANLSQRFLVSSCFLISIFHETLGHTSYKEIFITKLDKNILFLQKSLKVNVCTSKILYKILITIKNRRPYLRNEFDF